LQEALDITCQLGECSLCGARTRDDDDIMTWLEHAFVVIHQGAQSPLDQIPLHCVADTFADHEAEAVLRMGCANPTEGCCRAVHRAPSGANCRKIGAGADALGPFHNPLPLAAARYATVRRQRPLRRRDLSTLRPLCVDMRLMKPCTRLRGIRFG
jgi:hypothetical protein